MGEYAVLRELARGRSWLAVGPGGNRVVLKALAEDCLVGGQLHAAVRDRLGRVRELAHPKVANLLGVERIDSRAYLVWEFVEGRTLEEHARGCEGEALVRLAREVVLAVEELNALGIVHGALHGRNVIVDELGQVRLTHVSPLLWGDPAEDAAAVVAMLKRGAGEGSALGRIMGGAEGLSLRALGARLAPGAGAGEAGAARRRRRRREVRHRAWLGAVGVALAGAALAYGIGWWVERQTPRPPAPPEAPAAAMEEPVKR